MECTPAPPRLSPPSPGDDTTDITIAQEALNNVVKHAAARQVALTLSWGEAGFEMTIADDGRGFDSGAAPVRGPRGGWGIAGMRERALAMGARLAVQANPGLGARLVVTLPREG